MVVVVVVVVFIETVVVVVVVASSSSSSIDISHRICSNSSGSIDSFMSPHGHFWRLDLDYKSKLAKTAHKYQNANTIKPLVRLSLSFHHKF